MKPEYLIDIFHSLPTWFLPFLVLLILLQVLPRRFNHLPKVWISYRRLGVLHKISNPGQQFAYLRSVNPFVFEEMILSAFKKMGFVVKRNRRYSGDGGIDGRVIVDGQVYLIQAKRYAGHINPAHVSSFVGVCKRFNCKGLFIHTGKTGPKSRLRSSGVVDIVSGERMLRLMNVKEFRFF